MKNFVERLSNLVDSIGGEFEEDNEDFLSSDDGVKDKAHMGQELVQLFYEEVYSSES